MSAIGQQSTEAGARAVEQPSGVTSANVKSAAQPQLAGPTPLPYTQQEFRAEIARVKRARVAKRVAGGVIAALVVAAIGLAIALGLPEHFAFIESGEMAPTLEKGQVAFVQRGAKPVVADVIAYRAADGRTHVKRVIATSGEWVNVASNGQLTVSTAELAVGTMLESEGELASIVASVQVPDQRLFVIGDAEVGSAGLLQDGDNYITDQQVIGKAVYRIWPPDAGGRIN